MTETTSIYGLTHNKRTYSSPTVAAPGFFTFISQAIFGGSLGCFLLMAVLIVSDSPQPSGYGVFFILTLAAMLGIVMGTPVGLFMWVFTKLGGGVPSRTFRVTITFLLLAIICFAWVLLTYNTALTSHEQGWVLLWILVPGITTGLLTGSTLRLGRELIRGGDTILFLPRVLAGVSGVALRLFVVLLCKASVLALISLIVLDYYNKPIPEPPDQQWIPVAFVHCTFAVFVLFARMKIELLAVLTALMNVPFVASFWMYPNMPATLRYWLLGYLIAWGLFLVSRWRQTDVALGVLKEELRYYLID
jgi:hypothetical protein